MIFVIPGYDKISHINGATLRCQTVIFIGFPRLFYLQLVNSKTRAGLTECVWTWIQTSLVPVTLATQDQTVTSVSKLTCCINNHLCADYFFRKHEYMFNISHLPGHWNVANYWDTLLRRQEHFHFTNKLYTRNILSLVILSSVWYSPSNCPHWLQPF